MDDRTVNPPAAAPPNPNGSTPLDALLANPTLLQSVAKLLGGSSAPPPGTADAPSPTAPATPAEESTAALSDGLAQALSDPALMEKLPQMLSLLKPMLESGTQPSNAEATPAIALAPSARRGQNCRDDLLLALKPFLSKERCEAVDAILRISRLGQVLKHLN